MLITRFDKQNERHIKLLQDLYADPTAREFFRRIPPDLTPAQIVDLEAITGHTLYVLAFETVLIGVCNLGQVDSYGQSCHFGIVLRQQFRHAKDKGLYLAQVAVQGCVDWIFANTLFNKISFRFLAKRKDIADNLAAHGLKLAGVFEEAIFFQGDWLPEYEYELTRTMYKNLQGGAV